MSTVGSYPVSNFSPTQYFLVYNPSSQTLERVLGSELVTAINGDAVYVRAVSTRAVAQTLDLEIGVILQTGGGAVAGDGGSGAFLVVATGEGDFVMNNGNELLALPRGSLAGSDLDGATITDSGTTTNIEVAVSRRQVVVPSVADLYGGDWSQYDYLDTQAFTAGGSVGGAQWYKNGTGGTQTTSGTLLTHLALGYVVDAGGNYWYLRLDQNIKPSLFGATFDGSTDDQPAINAMFGFLRTFTFNYGFISTVWDTGKYVVDGPVDCTNFRSSFLVVDLNGSTVSYEGSGGDIVWDAVGTRNLSLKNGYIRGESSGGSAASYGYVQGRLDDGSVASKNTCENLTVNGYFTGAAGYNYAGEQFTSDRCNWNNLYSGGDAFVITRTNIDSVTSSFVSMGTSDQSCNHHRFIAGEFRCDTDRAGLYCESGIDVVFEARPFMSCTKSGGSNVAYITLDAQTGSIDGVTIPNFYCERVGGGTSMDHIMYITSSSARAVNNVHCNMILSPNVGDTLFYFDPQSNSEVYKNFWLGGYAELNNTGNAAPMLAASATYNASYYNINVFNRPETDGSISFENFGTLTGGSVRVDSRSDFDIGSTLTDYEFDLIAAGNTQHISKIPQMTIASGVVTWAGEMVGYVDTESAAATDDLDYITTGIDGDVFELMPYSIGRNVVVRHEQGSAPAGTSNISTTDGASITLDASPGASTRPGIRVRYNGRKDAWVVVE